MLALVYTSSATAPFDDSDLALLLMNSRSTNRRHDLTGFLLHKDGQFLQYLEGPDDQVEARLERISADPRHSDISVLFRETATVRRFPEWTMGYETVTDTLAAEIPGYRDVFTFPLAPAAASSGMSVAVRQLVAWFQARTLTSA